MLCHVLDREPSGVKIRSVFVPEEQLPFFFFQAKLLFVYAFKERLLRSPKCVEASCHLTCYNLVGCSTPYIRIFNLSMPQLSSIQLSQRSDLTISDKMADGSV